MDEPRHTFVAYIGETDIFEWTQGAGKPILMPELLCACEELLYNDLLEIKAARIEASIRGKKRWGR